MTATVRASLSFDVPILDSGDLNLRAFTRGLPEDADGDGDKPEVSPVAAAITQLVDDTVAAAVERALEQHRAHHPEAAQRPDHITVAEAAGLLRRSTRTIHRYISTGRLRAVQVAGGPVLIPREDLDKLIGRAKRF